MNEEKTPTSRLQGWDYINSLMDKCPICNGQATLGTDAISGRYRVCCMNICCSNMTNFLNDSWGKAIVNWNRYCRGVKL